MAAEVGIGGGGGSVGAPVPPFMGFKSLNKRNYK